MNLFTEKQEGEFEMYRAVELKIQKYVKIITIIFSVTGVLHITFPMMQIFYKHLQGTYDISQRQHPTPLKYLHIII